MGDFSELELQILLYCKNQGYRYAAVNDGHVRVMKTNTKPVLVGNMYRVDSENGTTYFGETLFVPGLFKQTGYLV